MLKEVSTYFFGDLVSKYNFELKRESVSDEYYLVEYLSENYGIKLEKYHREFYPIVYSVFEPQKEINFFNLILYLGQGGAEIPRSNYFREEKDIEKCYKKQLNHISSSIYQSLELLDDFFSKDSYEQNLRLFQDYWKSQHPELY